MQDQAPPKKGQTSETIKLSPEEIKLLESYDKAWPNRLRDGFQRGNAFFAWIMVASRLRDEWPEWCVQYLHEISKRLLAHVSAGDPYHSAPIPFDFDDSRTMFCILGIDLAKKQWDQAHPFWIEFEEYLNEPDWMSEVWDAGTQFSQRELILHEELVDDIKKRIRKHADATDKSFLQASFDVAQDGVEFDMSKGEIPYETYSSMLRGMRNRRNALLEQMVKHEPARPSRIEGWRGTP